MEKSQHTQRYQRLIAVLKKARETAGVTQAQVAERLGLYASFVSKVESGERRLDVVELAELCEAYDTTLLAVLREAGFVAD
jgi:transcriptional regulator with XRE-family HTH domain